MASINARMFLGLVAVIVFDLVDRMRSTRFGLHGVGGPPKHGLSIPLESSWWVGGQAQVEQRELAPWMA
ncbi:MAG: hypothetical protein HHJ16_03640 [Polaromonas sp.]|uniref:hypothetical protein n=1 Tax=Polaromonas sp. TaxID=1869339 RepID=UPI0017A64E65|nr:hypothetical protein [Polaromonas sp.]NMM09346.1 hypothetical protein [Polaromonas sp.]